MELSLDNLLEFLDWLAAKGFLAKNTAFGRKAACSAVLGILDPEERQNVAELDLDQVMSRFATLEGKRYAPKSLKVYRGRVQSSISDYIRYKSDPENFKIQAPQSSGGNNKVTNRKKPGNESKKTDEIRDTSIHMTSSNISPNVYPIPIRVDLVVRIHGLPFDLTKAEAERIANVVKAMAME